MRTCRGKSIIVALIPAIGILLAAAPVLAVDDLSLNISPGSERVLPGDTVTATLNVASLSGAINGVQILFRYDSSLMTLVDIVPADLGLTLPAAGWVEIAQDDVAGDVTFAASINGGEVVLDHQIATLTFLAIAEGTTTLAFRPDAPPFLTKLTLAIDNSTILPNKIDSGAILITCSDLLFCNGTETFVGGVCQPGTPPCDDGVGCTDDSCDEVADSCTNTANDANCADLNFCNGAEICDVNLDCQPGTDPCNDGVGCTVDSCDELLDLCSNAPDDAVCSDGVFCNGVEVCNLTLDCQPGSDPCAPLVCDEPSGTCLANVQIDGLELFYPGRFLTCRGGTAAGTGCAVDADCPSGRCTELADPDHDFLAVGATASLPNVINYARGVTGIRVVFNQEIVFATTPEAAFLFEWTTGADTVFTAVTDAATAITVTPLLENGVTVVRIELMDNHVRRRWLKVTVDATQISSGGVALDGELSGSPTVFPSGDTVPGGDSVFYVGNASGDVDGDLKTTLTDVATVRLVVNPFVQVGITNDLDLDKDGKLLLIDVAEARLDVNPFFSLPLITP